MGLVQSANLHSVGATPRSINLLKYYTPINLFSLDSWLIVGFFDKMIVTMLTLLLW